MTILNACIKKSGNLLNALHIYQSIYLSIYVYIAKLAGAVEYTDCTSTKE